MLTTRQWAESILLADCPYEDLTTVGLGIEETCGTVSASLKAPGIAAGIDLAREIFLAAGASVEVFAKDGDSLAARVPFLCARGSAQALHATYKTAQCVMEYAGGIAERTRAMVDAARSVNPQAVVAGTRKHYPGGKRIALTGLLAGGGTVHRLGLSDSILVFDQHRVFTDDFAGAFARLKAANPGKKTAVEASCEAEAREFIELGADIVQCERFAPEALARTADFAKRLGRGTLLSAAGGVNAENAAAYTAAGAVILVTSWPYWGRPRDVKMTFAREA